MEESLELITKVAMYPIKSGQPTTVNGVPVCQLEVGEVGFELQGFRDREFVIVNTDPDNPNQPTSFVSQRGWAEQGRRTQYPNDKRLAQLGTNIINGTLEVTTSSGSFQLGPYDAARPTHDVLVHNSLLPAAIDQGDEAAGVLSDYLERPVRLMRANRELPRLLPEQYQRDGASNKVAGADGMPFLLMSRTSLLALHEHAQPQNPIPTMNYRPNIIIDGSVWGAFGEDHVRRAQTAGVLFHFVKPCSRCVMVSVNPNNPLGPKTEGLSILKTRRGTFPETGEQEMYLGQNLNPAVQQGATIRAGQKIVALSWDNNPNVILDQPDIT